MKKGLEKALLEIKLLFSGIKAFKQELTNLYGDLDEEKTISRKLKKLRQVGLIQKYISEFREITLVIK